LPSRADAAGTTPWWRAALAACVLGASAALAVASSAHAATANAATPLPHLDLCDPTAGGAHRGLRPGSAGPPAYNLNPKVVVTVIIAKNNRVAANLALTNPNLTDDASLISAAIANLLK